MAYKAKEVRRLLLTKFGFQEVKESGHDAVAFFYVDKKIATTRFSRGSKAGDEITDSLLKQIAKQTRVNQLRFLKVMLDCTQDYDAYVAKLKEDRFI
jgi:predicted RNA binding protein YcfA (HicA-like mRNA interferase family)